MAKPKKILKIIGGVIIFFTLPSLLFFAYMYFKYNEDLPTGIEGKDAHQLAIKMLNALDYDAYKATDYIEFTFKKRHHFKWNKAENTCEVYWKNIRVNLDLISHDNSEVYVSEEAYHGEDVHDYIHKAEDLFNNDTFWLVAPYKVFDDGVKLKLVNTENSKEALLVTYTSGGSTPGDSYLWHFDDNGKPVSYQMWTDLLPIDGLEASWSDWTATETGAQLPTFHKLLFMGLEIEGIKTNIISNRITCSKIEVSNPNNDGSTDEELDDIYTKTCKFKNFTSISISNPDYQGRTSWDYSLLKNGKPANNSDLFISKTSELEQLLNDRFRNTYEKNLNNQEIRDCFKSTPYVEQTIDEFVIEFDENQTIRILKYYPVSNACLNVKFAIELFKIEELSKFMKIQ